MRRLIPLVVLGAAAFAAPLQAGAVNHGPEGCEATWPTVTPSPNPTQLNNNGPFSCTYTFGFGVNGGYVANPAGSWDVSFYDGTGALLNDYSSSQHSVPGQKFFIQAGWTVVGTVYSTGSWVLVGGAG